MGVSRVISILHSFTHKDKQQQSSNLHPNMDHTGSDDTSINVFSFFYFNCSARIRQAGPAVPPLVQGFVL